MKSSRIIFLVIIFLLFNISSSINTAGPRPYRMRSYAPAVHIIYAEQPQDSEEEPEYYHIRILTSVLGSEEAVRVALINSFQNAAFVFSDKFTPDQLAQISAQPGVLQVVPW